MSWMRGRFWAHVFHGPRPTHGPARWWGIGKLAKGRTASAAMNLAVERLARKVQISEEVDAIWRSQGSPLPWCVYHKSAVGLCAHLHPE